MLKKSIITIGFIAAIASIYYGAYLPLAKAQRYIIALQSASKVRTVQQFKNNFNSPLVFYSPIGNEEIIKFLTNDMIGIVGRSGQPEAVVRALVEYIEPYAFKNNVRHLLALGTMYEALWKEYKKESDFLTAENYYREAHAIGPKLPTVLFRLFNLYKAHGDQEKMLTLAEHIVTYWPDALVPNH